MIYTCFDKKSSGADTLDGVVRHARSISAIKWKSMSYESLAEVLQANNQIFW